MANSNESFLLDMSPMLRESRIPQPDQLPVALMIQLSRVASSSSSVTVSGEAMPVRNVLLGLHTPLTDYAAVRALKTTEAADPQS